MILVGEDPASQVYVRNKENACNRAGIRSTVLRLPESCTQKELEDAVLALNADEQVHGILVQLPLPAGFDATHVINSINPDKDVDGFHAVNAGRLALGEPGLVPCTPLGCLLLLREHVPALSGLHALVIGRSNIVGKPLAQLLLAENSTVTVSTTFIEPITIEYGLTPKSVCRTALRASSCHVSAVPVTATEWLHGGSSVRGSRPSWW